METQLLNIINPDQNQRQEATEYFTRLCKESPNETAQSLLNLILQSEDGKILDLSSLILHKNILSQKQQFERVEEQTLQNIFSQLMEIVFTKQNLSNSLVYRIAEICVKIGVSKQIHLKMVEILKQKITMQNQTSQQILFILYALELLCEFTEDQVLLEQINNEINQYVYSCMKNQNTEIKTQAVLVLGNIMLNIKNPLFLTNFSQIFEDMLNLTIEIIQNQDEKESLKMINNLQNLTVFQPKFIASYIEKIIFIITEVIKSDQLPEGIRVACSTYLITLCESNVSELKNSQFFKETTLVTILRVLIANVDDNQMDELEGFVENNVENKSIYSSLIITISNITSIMSGKYLLLNYMPYCREALQSNDWKAQHVALVMIGILSEDAKKHFSQELGQLMSLVLPFLKNNNPKVSYSALTCVGMLCAEFSPEIQKQYGEQIIQDLLRLMEFQNEQNIPLNTRAVSCAINFTRELQNEDDGEELSFEILEPYCNKINQAIQLLFQKSVELQNFKLLSEILSFISVYSNIMQTQFQECFDLFMSNIKNLLMMLENQELNDNQIQLKGQLIDASSWLLKSCQQQSQVQKYLSDFVNYLASTLNKVEEDSILIKSILNFFSVISLLDKELFKPFLNDVLILALKYASKDIEIHFEDKEVFTKKSNKYNSFDLDMKIFGGKKVLSFNHSLYQSKRASCKCLTRVLKNFYDCLTQDNIMNLIQLFNTEFVKNTTAEIKVMMINVLKNVLKALPQQQASQLFDEKIELIINYALQHYGTDGLDNSFEILHLIFKLIKTLTRDQQRGTRVSIQQPKSIILFKNLLTQTCQEFKRVSTEFLKQGLEPTEDEFLDEYEFLSNYNQRVMEISGELVKFDLDKDMLGFITGDIANYFVELQKCNYSHMDQLYPLCYYTDMIEFAPEQLVGQFVQQSLNLDLVLLQQNSDDVDLMQTVFFNIGCLFLKGQLSMVQIQQLQAILQTRLDQKPEEDELELYDNALAAMLKMYLAQSNNFTEEQVLNAQNYLYQQLPLKNDLEESRCINRYLVLSVQQNLEFTSKSEQRQLNTKQYFMRLKQQLNSQKMSQKMCDKMTMEFLQNLN